MEKKKSGWLGKLGALLCGVIAGACIYAYGYLNYVPTVTEVTVYALSTKPLRTGTMTVYGRNSQDALHLSVPATHVGYYPRLMGAQSPAGLILLDPPLVEEKKISYMVDGFRYSSSPLMVFTTNPKAEGPRIVRTNINRVTRVQTSYGVPLAFVHQDGKRVVMAQKDGSVDFTQWAEPVTSKEGILAMAALFIGSCVYGVFACGVIGGFFRALRNAPVVVLGVLGLLSLAYTVVYPGLFGMDFNIEAAWSGVVNPWHSAAFGMLETLLAAIDYNALVVFNVLACFAAVMLPLAYVGRMAVVRQFFCLMILAVFFAVPSIFISVFGIQRVCTNHVLVFLLVSAMWCLYRYRPESKTLLSFAWVVWVIATAVRPENVLFILPLLIATFAGGGVPFPSLLKAALATVCAVLFFGSSAYFFGNPQQDLLYRVAPVKSIVMAYADAKQLSKEELAGLHAYFHDPKATNPFDKKDPVASKHLRDAFELATKKIASNPMPLLARSFDRFKNTAMGPLTGGERTLVLDKKLMHEAYKNTDLTAKSAARYFLMQTDIYPLGRDAYAKVTSFLSANPYGVANGVLVATVFLFAIAPLVPFVFRRSYLLAVNFVFACQFVYLFFGTFIPFSMYYAGLVFWMLALCYWMCVKGKEPAFVRVAPTMTVTYKHVSMDETPLPNIVTDVAVSEAPQTVSGRVPDDFQDGEPERLDDIAQRLRDTLAEPVLTPEGREKSLDIVATTSRSPAMPVIKSRQVQETKIPESESAVASAVDSHTVESTHVPATPVPETSGESSKGLSNNDASSKKEAGVVKEGGPLFLRNS